METNNYIILQNTDRRYIQRKFLGKTMPCVCVCVRALSSSVMSNSFHPVDCSLPDSSVHGIIPARILEWFTISSSRKPSRVRDQTHLLWLLRWQADSLPLCHLGNSWGVTTGNQIHQARQGILEKLSINFKVYKVFRKK